MTIIFGFVLLLLRSFVSAQGSNDHTLVFVDFIRQIAKKIQVYVVFSGKWNPVSDQPAQDRVVPKLAH